MIAPRRLLPLPLLLLALAGAGCGDERTGEEVRGGGTEAQGAAEATSTAEDTSTAAEAPTETSAASPSAAVTQLADGVGDDLDTAPTITSPTGTPPSSLVSRDIVEGSGTAAKSTDQVTVRYTLVVWGGDSTPVDSSWNSQPDDQATFGLDQVIPGWTKGVSGMKPGGRRLLVVPPEDGYGATGGGSVPPNATLIFVVDLVRAS